MKRFAGVLAFVAGAGLAVVAALWRIKAAESAAPAFIVITGLALGSVGWLLVRIGRGLVEGKSLAVAAGVDESRKTSKVTLVFAALLFVPLWLMSLSIAISSIAPGNSVERLVGWSIAAAFFSLVVMGLVREWRRPLPGGT